MSIDMLRRLYLIIFEFADGKFRPYEKCFTSIPEVIFALNELSMFSDFAVDGITHVYVVDTGNVYKHYEPKPSKPVKPLID